jgi:hypothetical protein
MWNKTSIISRQENIHWQQVDESIVILNPIEGKSHELNETGMYLWKQLESEQTFSSLLDELCSDYNVTSEEASKDITEFITLMLEQKLIKSSNE